MKGNLVVGQSGGPTAVINNSLVGVVHEAMKYEEIHGIYGMLHGIVGILDEYFVDLRKESEETLEGLRHTPASALGTVRYRVTDEDYDRLIEVLQAYDIRYFFYIGGNDSMDTTHKIHLAAQEKGYELLAVGVPKTIDNDLVKTDHCPGYGSAARFVASAIRNSGWDTEAMGESGPLKLMEIMGRNAGWLTASAALAKQQPKDPPHLIYLPERGRSLEQIVEDVEGTYERYGSCVIAVSEGFKDDQGREFGTLGDVFETDAFGHRRKGGVASTLTNALKQHLDMLPRFDKPGYLQRSFGELASPVDREEAYDVGRAAVRAVLAGETDKMVTLVRQPGPEYEIEIGLADLDEVANKERLVPDEFIDEEGNFVTEAFLDYARPLIGPPLAPYARLDKHPVPKRAKVESS
ncbi:MAG: 6-phosphofructokinase [Anaerolineales bacterium]